MKILCPACGAVAPLAFSIDGEAIEVTCSVCCSTSRAEAHLRRTGPETETRQATRSSTTAATERCPKCDAGFDGGDACRGCGLLVQHFESYVAPAPKNPHFDQAWSDLEQKWEQVAAHDSFVAQCSVRGDFAHGAQRYRAVLRARPGDAAAERGLARLTRMVEVTMKASSARGAPVADEPTPFKGAVALLLLAIVLVVAGVSYAWVRSSAQGGATVESPATALPRPGR